MTSVTMNKDVVYTVDGQALTLSHRKSVLLSHEVAENKRRAIRNKYRGRLNNLGVDDFIQQKRKDLERE